LPLHGSGRKFRPFRIHDFEFTRAVNQEIRLFGSALFSNSPSNSRMAAKPARDSETPFIKANYCDLGITNCPLIFRLASTMGFKWRKSPGEYWISSTITGGGCRAKKIGLRIPFSMFRLTGQV
jgi:hypothetical protein